MVSARSVSHLVTLAILFTTARTQVTRATNGGTTNRKTTPSSTSRPASSTSTARAAFTTAVVPIYLYSAVDSLLTHYFPSTTPHDLAAVSWPSTLVIGTATYGLHSGQRETPVGLAHSAPSPDPSPSSSATNKQTAAQRNDKRLGIILGVVIGSVAIAVMAVLFWCLARRRRRTGSFFMRRSTLSASSTRSRRLGAFGASPYVSGGSSRRPNMSEMRQNEPALLRPAVLHHHSSRSTSEDNPFYTPLERRSGLLDQHELEGRRVEQSELDHNEPAHRRSSSSVRDARPPTPFSPAMMQRTRDRSQQQQPQNPFSSAEDPEGNNTVSPILPSKSFEQRNSPMIHYPSIDEVSEFDFAGDGRNRASVDGKIGWHPVKERIYGRHELA